MAPLPQARGHGGADYSRTLPILPLPATAQQRGRAEHILRLSLAGARSMTVGTIASVDCPLAKHRFERRHRGARVLDAFVAAPAGGGAAGSLAWERAGGARRGCVCHVGRIAEGGEAAAGAQPGARSLVLCRVAVGKSWPHYGDEPPTGPPPRGYDSFVLCGGHAKAARAWVDADRAGGGDAAADGVRFWVPDAGRMILPCYLLRYECDVGGPRQLSPGQQGAEGGAAAEVCQYHADQRRAYFCTTCHIALCVECKLTGHHSHGECAGHAMVPLAQAHQAAVAAVSNPLPLLWATRTSMTRQREALQVRATAIQHNTVEVRHQLAQLVSCVSRQIDEAERVKLAVLHAEELELSGDVADMERGETFLEDQAGRLGPATFIHAWAQHVDMRWSRSDVAHDPTTAVPPPSPMDSVSSPLPSPLEPRSPPRAPHGAAGGMQALLASPSYSPLPSPVASPSRSPGHGAHVYDGALQDWLPRAAAPIRANLALRGAVGVAQVAEDLLALGSPELGLPLPLSLGEEEPLEQMPQEAAVPTSLSPGKWAWVSGSPGVTEWASRKQDEEAAADKVDEKSNVGVILRRVSDDRRVRSSPTSSPARASSVTPAQSPSGRRTVAHVRADLLQRRESVRRVVVFADAGDGDGEEILSPAARSGPDDAVPSPGGVAEPEAGFTQAGTPVAPLPEACDDASLRKSIQLSRRKSLLEDDENAPSAVFRDVRNSPMADSTRAKFKKGVRVAAGESAENPAVLHPAVSNPS